MAEGVKRDVTQRLIKSEEFLTPTGYTVLAVRVRVLKMPVYHDSRDQVRDM